MGLQRRGINPLLADPKRPRPAVGDQMQRLRQLTRRPLRLQCRRDRHQGLLDTIPDHQRLGTLQEGLDLRAPAIAEQQMI